MAGRRAARIERRWRWQHGVDAGGGEGAARVEPECRGSRRAGVGGEGVVWVADGWCGRQRGGMGDRRAVDKGEGSCDVGSAGSVGGRERRG